MDEEHMFKFSNMKCQRVNAHESFVPTVHDDAMEIDHLLARPKSEDASIDHFLHFQEKNSGKSCDAGKQKSGGLDSYATMAGDVLKLEVLDGLLDGVDEVDDLHATSGLSCASDVYLFDFEYAERASRLVSDPCEGLLSGNSSSESHSPGFSGSSTSAGGILEPSAVQNLVSECKNGSLGKAVSSELPNTFRNKIPSKIGDGMDHKSSDTQNFDELDYDEIPLARQLSSDKNEKASLEPCQIGIVREKRLRKPTQRYIEEFSNLKSKEKVSSSATKSKRLPVSSRNRNHDIGFQASKEVSDDEPTSETSDLVLSELQVPKGHSIKEELESDEEFSPSESEDDYVATKRSKKHDRRKHQRMWTLSEVIKLIDGISEYGVGRWTEIKRVLFSSSPYRTPIDLRDKWRNLLRASCAKELNKKEAGRKQENALRSLPKSMLLRVSELAKLHPYPRERCTKNLCLRQVSSRALPTQKKGSQKKPRKRWP